MNVSGSSRVRWGKICVVYQVQLGPYTRVLSLSMAYCLVCRFYPRNAVWFSLTRKWMKQCSRSWHKVNIWSVLHCTKSNNPDALLPNHEAYHCAAQVLTSLNILLFELYWNQYTTLPFSNCLWGCCVEVSMLCSLPSTWCAVSCGCVEISTLCSSSLTACRTLSCVTVSLLCSVPASFCVTLCVVL